MQPYSNKGSMEYYIAAGWNNETMVPNSFEIGDKRQTSAVRNGFSENYYNAELSRNGRYCIYIVIHGQWNISGVRIN